MGLFSFLSGLFGANEKVREEISREISFAEAVKAHVAWKNRLEKVLDGTSEEQLDPAVVCRDDRCVLGKWIHGPGGQRFGRDVSFHGLRETHADFHVHAADILVKSSEGKKAEAKAILEGSYREASHKVVGMLTELERTFGRR